MMVKVHNSGLINKLGRLSAKQASSLFVNPTTENWARLFEAYWCALLGKGAGSGWAMDAEINAAKSVIDNPFPIIFDVGANIGDWASHIYKFFPNSRLFLFEPLPKCQEIILSRNIPNSELISKAISSQIGTFELSTAGDTSRIASLHKRKDTYSEDKEFESIQIETTTVDEVIEFYGLEKVDFMKMDIEGHELFALKGAEKSLEKGKIKAFSFEFGIGNINSRTYFLDFWELLNPHYRIYRILPSSRLMEIREYYEDCEYFRGATNYVAVLR